MHRTLKADVASPPKDLWTAQELALEDWRLEFNEQRPHEALKMRTPAEVHEMSPRPCPEHVGDVEYPSHSETRRVHRNGATSLGSTPLNVAPLLAGELVGLEPIEDGLGHLWFGPVFLGRIKLLRGGKAQLKRELPNGKSAKTREPV